MTDECISPLRQRMIDDMSMRHFGEKTQKNYIRVVKNLAIFLKRSPDTASNEDLRHFQLHLAEQRVGVVRCCHRLDAHIGQSYSLARSQSLRRGLVFHCNR